MNDAIESTIRSCHASSDAIALFTCQDVLLRPAESKLAGVETLHHGCATHFLVPRMPVLFLTRVAAVSGDLALRANLEVLHMAHKLAPLVNAIYSPLQRSPTQISEMGH